MAAYGFPRRRDTIGVAVAAVKLGLQAAGVALLPYSSNVSLTRNALGRRQNRCLRANQTARMLATGGHGRESSSSVTNIKIAKNEKSCVNQLPLA